LLEPYSEALGVGSKEEPAPAKVRGSNLGGTDSRPAEIVPEAGQLETNATKSSCPDRRDVFKEDESRAYFFRKPDHV
jgi:hypothetical protein